MSKELLVAEVARLTSELGAANAALEEFDSLPENNVFESLEKAESVLEDRMRNMAFEDCEGAGNCGAPEYKQEFIVDGAHYVGKLTVEYNRHDKTYYFIDSSDFTVEPVPQILAA